MMILQAQCLRFPYGDTPHFVSKWAHKETEAALIHEGLIVLKFYVHERDPVTGDPSLLSLLRRLENPPDDELDCYHEPEDDYWGNPDWKHALGQALSHEGPPPEALTFPIPTLVQTLKVMANRAIHNFILKTAHEVQVPRGFA